MLRGGHTGSNLTRCTARSLSRRAAAAMDRGVRHDPGLQLRHDDDRCVCGPLALGTRADHRRVPEDNGPHVGRSRRWRGGLAGRAQRGALEDSALAGAASDSSSPQQHARRLRVINGALSLAMLSEVSSMYLPLHCPSKDASHDDILRRRAEWLDSRTQASIMQPTLDTALLGLRQVGSFSAAPVRSS